MRHSPAPHVHENRGGHHGDARLFAIGFFLNLSFVVVEASYGAISHSMALFADAGHNFGDVMGLGAAWGAQRLSRRAPTHRFTYGLGSSSILAALLNALILMIAVGAIAAEALPRLIAPPPVMAGSVVAVALLGVAINGVTALVLSRGARGELNVASALAHALSDAGISFGVAVSGAIVLATGWLWLDPAVSLVIAALIVASTWQLMRRALAMALHGVPHGIDPTAVRRLLAECAGVDAVHDLHIWPMSTTETALTAHLVMPGGHPGDAALSRLGAELGSRFGIGHVTIQIETGEAECSLIPDHVV